MIEILIFIRSEQINSVRVAKQSFHVRFMLTFVPKMQKLRAFRGNDLSGKNKTTGQLNLQRSSLILTCCMF